MESKLGKGSKFTVILPMPAVSGHQPAPESEPTKSASIDRLGLHILLAEDNELNMEIATEILTMNGITVTRPSTEPRPCACLRLPPPTPLTPF